MKLPAEIEKNLIEPESVHTKHSEKKCEKKKESSNLSKRNRNISCTFEVGSDYEFIQAIKKSEDGDKIVVTRDIYLPFGLEISKSVQIDKKTQKEINEKYSKILKDYINEKSKDIKSEKGTVEVDGKEKKCTK